MTIEFEIVNKTICLCARRASGKSQLMRYIILKNLKKFNTMFLVIYKCRVSLNRHESEKIGG